MSREWGRWSAGTQERAKKKQTHTGTARRLHTMATGGLRACSHGEPCRGASCHGDPGPGEA